MKNNTLIIPIKYLFLFISLIVLAPACSNSTSGDDEHEHEEADGFFLVMDADTIVTQLPKATVEGSIALTVGEETSLIAIYFIAPDGDEFQPEGEEHNLVSELSQDGIVIFEHNDSDKWSFRLKAETAGTTNLTLFLYHEDHPDFETQTIPVTVTSASN